MVSKMKAAHIGMWTAFLMNLNCLDPTADCPWHLQTVYCFE